MKDQNGSRSTTNVIRQTKLVIVWVKINIFWFDERRIPSGYFQMEQAIENDSNTTKLTHCKIKIKA